MNKQISVVTGCIIHENKVLMARRLDQNIPDADRKLDFPGGKAEFGETPEETVVREVREETGLSVKPVELIPYIHTNIWKTNKVNLSVILICFICKLVNEDPRVINSSRELDKLRWMDIGKIKLHNTLPGITEFLAWVAKEKFGIDNKHTNPYRSIYLDCIIPEENTDKFYFITDRPPYSERIPYQPPIQLKLLENNGIGNKLPGFENPKYLVSRTWGRNNANNPQYKVEYYFSDKGVIESIISHLRKRKSRNYSVKYSNLGNTYEEIISKLNQELDLLTS